MTFDEVNAVWNGLPDSKLWPAVDYIEHCVDMPECYVVGQVADDVGIGPYQYPYAVLDVREQRVLDEEEFPFAWLCGPDGMRKRWEYLQGSKIAYGLIGPVEAARDHDMLR